MGTTGNQKQAQYDINPNADGFYGIGSVVGPHPFPMMLRDFQRVVGEEAKEQFAHLHDGGVPDYLITCVGGGSNAIGLFSGRGDKDIDFIQEQIGIS